MPAASDTQPNVGHATHFTISEGGEWIEWNPDLGIPVSQTGVVFSVRFASGWVWDQLVGWRKSR